MFNKSEKGFALDGTKMIIIAAAVVGLIVWYVFSNFVESSRVRDAERVMSAAAEAQSRHMMNRGRYTLSWVTLNALPLAPYVKQKGEYVSEDGTVFMNKGGGMTNPNNGFKMYFDEAYNGKVFIVAERVNSRYHYTLVRPLGEITVYCLPSSNPLDEKFCMEYMHVNNVADLPEDPRPSWDD